MKKFASGPCFAAAVNVAFCGFGRSFLEENREDTTKARKERKDRARVLTMLHEEETKGMPSKRKLPRSKRRNRK